jgi:hypothetical protein
VQDIEDTLHCLQEKADQSKKGQYAVVYLGGYGKQSQIYTKGVFVCVCGNQELTAD